MSKTAYNEYCIQQYGSIKPINELTKSDMINISILTSFNSCKSDLENNYKIYKNYEINNIISHFKMSIPYLVMDDDNRLYSEEMGEKLKIEINEKLNLKNMSQS